MHYFFTRTPYRVTIEPKNKLCGDSYMPLYSAKIEFDFTEAAQCDGHSPAHGDLDRGFVETMLESTPWDQKGPPTDLVAAFHQALKEARNDPK